MNARQYYLPVILCGKPLYLFQNLLLLPASDPAPCIWDNTVRTKLITAILNLNKRPGMLCRLPQLHFFVLAGLSNIDQGFAVKRLFRCFLPGCPGLFPFCQEFLQNGHKILFLIIPYGKINA